MKSVVSRSRKPLVQVDNYLTHSVLIKKVCVCWSWRGT